MSGSEVTPLRWRWRDLPLRVKGIVVISIPIVPLLVSAIFLYSTQHRAGETDRSVAQALRIKALLDRTTVSVGDAEIAARQYVVSRSPEGLKQFRSASVGLSSALTEAARLITDDAQRERLRLLLTHAQGRPLSSLIDYAQKAPASAPVPVDLLDRSRAGMARLHADIAGMQIAEDALLASRIAEAQQARWRAFAVIITGAIGLIAGIIVALFFMATLARRIAAAANNARSLAAGEALQPMIVSRDEVGTLADALTRTFRLLQTRDLELQSRLNDLAAANTELEAFSYSVSHDLRAPLRHIAGFAALLEKRAGDRLDPEAMRYLQTITGSAARMGRLVDDLLAFSRMGRSDMLCNDVNLNEVVREVVQEVAQDTNGRTIRWSTLALPAVRGDRTMLRLALSNLVSNAVKYTSTRPVAEIEIGSEGRANGERVLYVRDNGVGFDMAYADKLFGVFQRLHGPDEFEGTGIGLANVRRIVHRHGGKTWAEGSVNHGATFFISLPA